MFVKSQQRPNEKQPEYKVFYRQINCNKKLFMLNLFLIDPKQIIQMLVKFIQQIRVTDIRLEEKQQKILFNCGQYELLRLFSNALHEVLIITTPGVCRSLLLKLFQAEVFKLPLSLDSSSTNLSEDELREVFEKPVTIERLNISKCKIADKGLRILSISERTNRLKSLNLSNLQITDKSLSEFIFSKAIENLQELCLSFCKNLSS